MSEKQSGYSGGDKAGNGRFIAIVVICLLVLFGYGVLTTFAIDPLADSDTRSLPPDQASRGAAGGVFWYGGIAGGK